MTVPGDDAQLPPPPSVPATHEPDRSRADRVLVAVKRSRLARFNAGIGVSAILISLIAAFSIARPHEFATGFNARTLTADASSLMVLATGLTFVVVSAGIDLSIGSVLVFASVISAKVMVALGGASAGWGAIVLGLLAAVAAGMGWGLLNGFLITKAKIPPLIVTLGTLGAALGLAQVVSSGQDVQVVPAHLQSTIGIGTAFGEIPWLFVIAAVLAIVFGLILRYTRFGRYTYACGSSPEAARRAGINVDRHLMKVYVIQAGLAGVAGWMSLAQFAGTTIAGHSSDNLNAIAAVVIGGCSLFGGVGTVAGSMVGVFIPAVLADGFLIVGLQAFWVEVAVGAVLILAVYLDLLRRRSANSA
jgi:ribose transport system permease protein